MAIHQIIPATAEHIAQIGPNVRQADRDEFWASHMCSPEKALRLGLMVSEHACVGLIDDEPVCMWGVAQESLVCNVGIPWLVATDRMEENAIKFLRHSRQSVMQELQRFNLLYNYVDARNERAMRWLEWVGFDIEETPIPYGALGLPFHKFTMERK